MSTAIDTSTFRGGYDLIYRHPIAQKVFYTDGARYVAEHAQAYWLLDKIAIVGPTFKDQYFQVWELDVATLTIKVTDGNSNTLWTEKLAWTTFPEPGVTLWFVDNIIMVPTEY